MKKILSVFLTVVFASCAVMAQSENDRNLGTWNEQGISHYRFNLFVGCFCPFGQDMPLIIEVKDELIVSMEYTSGNPIDASNTEYFRRFATIDRLFTEVENLVNGEADEVIVTYDPTYGFPTQISIDYIKNAVDDELSLTVSDFEPLP